MTNMDDKKKLLPVAIMAHNEEKVIQKAIESVFSQDLPSGYSVLALVTANGCSDSTEEIVKNLQKQYGERIMLISIREKGKTKALNKTISFLEHLMEEQWAIPYVVLLDADCQFIGKSALIDFIERFDQNPYLQAIGADCLPDVLFDSRKGIVAGIYRAIHEFGKDISINSISGMCYGIRLEVLRKIDFPDIQFAEDMYVSARLDGWFLRDRAIQIMFRTPRNLQSEIKRRTRQEISTQRYHDCYSYMKNQGKKVKLFEGALREHYRWWGANDNDMLKTWMRVKGIKTKFLVVMYISIRALTKIKAAYHFKKMRKNSELDYWKVER